MRRLPVVQDEPPEDAAAAHRPEWQWIVGGAALALVIWMPLAAVATPLGARLAARWLELTPESTVSELVGRTTGDRVLFGVLTAGPPLFAFALSCLAAGAVIGRFGRRARRRSAGMAGFAAGAVGWSVAAASGIPMPWFVALTALVTLGGVGAIAALGGQRLGAERGGRPK